ncbi:hypothetical protein BGLY_2892 [Bacillus glycinifermentans]|nr:hypothetical protein BGLY_2892 [Bacillus glycinifermentans]
MKPALFLFCKFQVENQKTTFSRESIDCKKSRKALMEVYDMKFFFGQVNPTVLTMAALRVVSSLIELTAAIVMLLLNDVRKAVAVNSVLAMVGPFIFIITMTIGIYQIAGQLSYAKLILIFMGVVFIIAGIYK